MIASVFARRCGSYMI